MKNTKFYHSWDQIQPKFSENHTSLSSNDNFLIQTNQNSKRELSFLNPNYPKEIQIDILKYQKKTSLRKYFKRINISLLFCSSILTFFSIIILIVLIVLGFNSKPLHLFLSRTNSTETNFNKCNPKLNIKIFTNKKKL